LLIGCGALLLLLGIAAIVLVAKRAEFVGWMFQKLEAQILAKLPEDVTPEERQQLDRSFDAAAEAIGSGTANQAKADQLNAVLLELAQGGRQISREDVLKLTHALEEVAGKKQAVPDV
jgi:ATP-dependent exoDNAse (exonuclease V) alpha subunit